MVKEHYQPQSMRRTMIKSTIGTVRRSNYDLPDMKNPRHVYGRKNLSDPENAGQVISTWAHAVPTPTIHAGLSFKETNRQTVANGHLNASETRERANKNQDIRVKPRTKCKGGFVPTDDHIFGIKSKASEDIVGVVQARYTSFKNDEAEYPNMESMTPKGKLPLPRETRCSVMKDVRKNPMPPPSHHHSELFKLSRFKAVGPVLSTQPNAPKCEKIEDKTDS